MSAEIVNLRRVRKARQRADKVAESATNRVVHGRTKAEREVEASTRERAERGLDGHRLEKANDDGDLV